MGVHNGKIVSNPIPNPDHKPNFRMSVPVGPQL